MLVSSGAASVAKTGESFSLHNILLKDPPDRRNGNLKKFLVKLFKQALFKE